MKVIIVDGDKTSLTVDLLRYCESRGILVEEKFTPTNTGSPKLPLMRFEVYARLGCSITEDEGVATKRYREIVNDVYDLLERQLRAGA